MAERLEGGCHCGNLRLEFHAAGRFEDLPIRACQCSFCRKHNVRATADPGGRLDIVIRNRDSLSAYRMGHGITDYLVCRDCGVYVAAVMEDENAGGLLATCIVNALDVAPERVSDPVPIDYGGETPEVRRGRRRQRWMPARMI